MATFNSFRLKFLRSHSHRIPQFKLRTQGFAGENLRGKKGKEKKRGKELRSTELKAGAQDQLIQQEGKKERAY